MYLAGYRFRCICQRSITILYQLIRHYTSSIILLNNYCNNSTANILINDFVTYIFPLKHWATYNLLSVTFYCITNIGKTLLICLTYFSSVVVFWNYYAFCRTDELTKIIFYQLLQSSQPIITWWPGSITTTSSQSDWEWKFSNSAQWFSLTTTWSWSDWEWNWSRWQYACSAMWA